METWYIVNVHNYSKLLDGWCALGMELVLCLYRRRNQCLVFHALVLVVVAQRCSTDHGIASGPADALILTLSSR